MANPRKFSEKIALQKQRQQEGTAEFERIMKEVYATKMDETQANQKILECCLVNTDITRNQNNSTNASLISGAGVGGGGGGGGGTNSTADGGGGGNGAATNTASSSSGGTSPDGTGIGGGGNTLNNNARESRGRSVGVGPMRRPSERKQDRSPYGNSVVVAGGMSAVMTNNAYLSPPMDSSWRRSNSDSALHQTLNMAVAAEGGDFGPAGMIGIGALPGDMHALHANYQHHNQRSHSSNIGRSFSPQAQRRKGQMLHQQQQQQQQQQQLHHSQQQLQLQQQHQQLQQHFHQQQQQQQQHMHQQAQQQQHVQQQQQHPASSVSQQQHTQHFNAKYTNSNMPINNIFKTLQEQSLALANTGSLPDLTSLHYAPAQQQQMLQQQQQQTLSPTLSPHNNGRDRDQSSSPFSPAGNGAGAPPSPYQQQQHSPTSAANTPTATQTSPHLSFTNLAVQSPNGSGSTTQNTAQTGNFAANLPTLGAASSTGNLTDYRQPLNPPSPGSSPGLLTSVASNDVVHISAPASPTRHRQTGMIGQGMQGYNEKNLHQTFDRYSPAMGGNALETAGYNSLNPAFQNHFEQFTLGDSNSSPEQQQQLQQHFQQQRQQQQQQQNSFAALGFGDFVSVGNGTLYGSQSLSQSKQLDFSDLTGVSASSTSTASATTTAPQNSRGGGGGSFGGAANNDSNTIDNNNTQQHSQQTNRILTHHLLNNNAAGGGSNSSIGNTNSPSCRSISNNNVNITQGGDVNSSPIPSPLGCLPSPSSPLPIPIAAQSPHHHHHQQMSLSLHSHSTQPSPHHSPLHSPHHASPLSSSSPGITTLAGGGTSSAPHNGGASMHHNQQHQQQTGQHHHQQQHHQQQQQQQEQQQQHHHHHIHQHQQNHANTPTATNIPAIIFSDYSSREIFDSLDLDLGQMDETALDLLADQNSIMIADPTIEDSFRKDLN